MTISDKMSIAPRIIVNSEVGRSRHALGRSRKHLPSEDCSV